LPGEPCEQFGWRSALLVDRQELRIDDTPLYIAAAP